MGKFYTMKKIRAQGGAEIGRIDIYGEISDLEFWGDETTPATFVEDLNKLGTVGEIEIHIFSNGGDPFAALAIYAELKRRSENVNVYIDGIAASAATVILCAGDTVFMDETSMLMVHNPYQLLCWAGLNAQDARELADELDKIREPMITAYMKKSSKTRDEVIALMDGENGKGTWLTAAEAIEFGLANKYTPDNKKPLEVAAMIKPGVYNYRGCKVDLTSYDKAAEKTAGIKNSIIGGNSMPFFRKKKNDKKTAAKVEPKAETTFVEMVCPSCGGTVNLNPETGETFVSNTQQAEPNGGGNEPAATLARRMPGNVKAAVYTVPCPHCGDEFVWDTDANADGDTAQQTTKAAPVGGNAGTAPAEPETTPVAELAQTVCPNCGAAVEYDTETVETGTDEAGSEGYALTCPECNTAFIEPFVSPAPEAIPVAASAEAKAAYRAGVLAERNRNLALDEMAQAAPALAGMVQAAKRSGASAEVMSRNVIKAMSQGKGGSPGASRFAAALGRDIQASGVNSMRIPRHGAAPKSVKASAYDRRIEEYNKARGGRDDA
jgi:ATP-dependent Clp protease protease subunit